jgi:hypothetical protein
MHFEGHPYYSEILPSHCIPSVCDVLSCGLDDRTQQSALNTNCKKPRPTYPYAVFDHSILICIQFCFQSVQLLLCMSVCGGNIITSSNAHLTQAMIANAICGVKTHAAYNWLNKKSDYARAPSVHCAPVSSCHFASNA